MVRSAWIEDSVRARRKLPVAAYMVDGVFVQKGTLAASFAAAATPKKLPPQSSAPSRKKNGLSSGGSMSSGKVRASSGGAGKSQSSHLAGTRPNGAGGPTAAADRAATSCSDRFVDSRGGVESNGADGGTGEERRRPGRGLEGTETAVAAGRSAEVGGTGPVVSRSSLSVGSGGGSSGGGGDGAPGAPLSLSMKDQPAVDEQRPDAAAVATQAPRAHASRSEGKHTPAGDNDSGNHRGTLTLKSKGGENWDEPTVRPSNGSESGHGDGDGDSGGGSDGVGGEGRKGLAAAGDLPPPFELPEMGAAGEGGRSTKDDPAFMKTFFRNSRLHFIGVG